MIGAGRPSVAKSIFYRCSKEICLASALGGVPVLCQWQSAERLRDMVELLLTDSFLMSYFALLTGLFALAAGLEFKWRFFSDSHQLWMKRLHHFLGEIGSSFLTAVRTALGATLGFMVAWHWAEPRTASFEGIFTLVVLTICATAASAALAFLDEILWDVRRAAAAAKN